MTGEDLITRLGVMSVSVFTIGRLHGIKELENLSMQMNELADDISRYDWHTGTPTEEGWYLLKLVDEYGRITYYANYLRKGKKGMEWKYAFFGHVIIKWQSIEDEPEVMMG